MAAVIVHSLSHVYITSNQVPQTTYQLLCILSLMYRGIGKKNLQSPCRRSNVLESGGKSQKETSLVRSKKEKKLVRRKRKRKRKRGGLSKRLHPKANDNSTNCTTS